jgi:hypothetical protein
VGLVGLVVVVAIIAILRFVQEEAGFQVKVIQAVTLHFSLGLVELVVVELAELVETIR